MKNGLNQGFWRITCENFGSLNLAGQKAGMRMKEPCKVSD
jgi:hypothetical protein